jgi:hypothetical protein
MAKANDVNTTSDEPEGPISNVIDMAGLCVVAFDYASSAGIADGDYIKIDRTTWNLLGWALQHQHELAKTLVDSFDASVLNGESA